MKLTNVKDYMVYVELADGAPVNASLEILTRVSRLAPKSGEQVTAVIIGQNVSEGAQTAIAAGADKVICVEKEISQLEEYVQILTAIGKKYQPRVFFFPATQMGKDLVPVLSYKFDTASITDVTDIVEKAEGFDYVCSSYNGNILNEISYEAGFPQIVSVKSSSFKKELDSSRTGEIISEDIPVDRSLIKTELKETVKEIAEAVNLEEAQVVVAGGRGMGSKENFELVKELADVCKGVVGATRPAIESEWISRAHQVGQSGKTVAPKLYIACGISGATQHISGMSGSGYIVAINKDEDASIFDIADVGIVGDAVKVIPLLIEAIKKEKAQ